MIDTKDLRQKITTKGLDVVADTDVLELLDRLEAAKTAWKEADKACRDLTEKVIPNIRERLEAAEKERDELRAKIEAMERQEPVAYQRLYKDGSGSEDITDLPDVFERQRPGHIHPWLAWRR